MNVSVQRATAQTRPQHHLDAICHRRLKSKNFALPPLGQQILGFIRNATGKGGAK